MKNWYNKNIDEVVKELNTHLETGLTSAEAQKRLKKWGPNQLKEGKGRSPLQMFFEQFKDILVIILLISALISGILGEITDSVVIVIILIINATLGVIQEYKAEKSLAALKKMAAPETIVIRNGQQQKLEASRIVPGDIVLLETGGYVPADMRLFAVSDLKVEESVLTGESVPVAKEIAPVDEEELSLGDQRNMVFMGTTIAYGRGRGIVTATGMVTEMGQIAGMLDIQKQEPTPLQKRIDQLGKKLGALTLLIVCLVVLIGLWRGIAFLNIFMTGISLAVAAVPEGLPAVVTIVLALGVQRMIKKHAIIRRLPAVETLGATTIICSDKTGTLTQNQMTVTTIYLPGRIIKVKGKGYKPEGKFIAAGKEIASKEDESLVLLLKVGALCNNAELIEKNGKWDIIGDPTEGALLVAAEKAGLRKRELERRHQRLREFPFDSGRKRMTTINEFPKGRYALVKGAPGSILKICTRINQNGVKRELTAEWQEKILEINREMAAKALRVLAVAYKPVVASSNFKVDEVENDLIFLGLIGMIDPPRQEVAASVNNCKKAGIRPVMITGDYALTARAIAEELGIYQEGDRIITGAELEGLSDKELEELVLKTSIFARVAPRHKSRIVKVFQKKGQVVAMTGDGVNDAPALKEADIGIAMGITGTDVSKEAADMVLTDDNFASIVAAVEEGRAIYDNIRKFIRFLLSCNIGEIVAIFGAIIVGLPTPLIPIQILWVNLITDSLPALALGVDPAATDLMARPPRDPEEGIFAGRIGFNIVYQGLFLGIITLTVFYAGVSIFSLPVARTMAFATLSFSQLSQALNSRSDDYSIFKIGVFSNRPLILAIIISGSLQLAVMLIPWLKTIFGVVALSGLQWLMVILFALTPSFFVEIFKSLGLSSEK